MLGVDVTASHRAVRDAFRQKAKDAHPDRGGTPEAFDALKQWLSDHQNRAEPGLRQLRQRVLNPKKASSSKDYWPCVTEWDRLLIEPKSFEGEIPNHTDVLEAYLKLLDSSSMTWALDKKADWKCQDTYAADGPEELLQRLRRGVEHRIREFQEHGPQHSLAGTQPSPKLNEDDLQKLLDTCTAMLETAAPTHPYTRLILPLLAVSGRHRRLGSLRRQRRPQGRPGP